ncbi:Uncharacterised protein [uncultured archaeon]|nr:Uncharacterised protein [uncultured archaeon]
MVKKRVRSKNRSKRGDKNFEKRFRGFNNGVDIVEKEIDREVRDVEKWILERRKFFIKLGWTVLLVLVLLIFSHFFLRVPSKAF